MTLKTEQIAALVAAAQEVRQNAYAPYSGFHVGAAVLCDDGSIVAGCNVENSSYSLTCCAERNAVFAAVAQGKCSFSAIAVATNGQTVAPCGACRQVLAEFDTAMSVILCGEGPDHRVLSLSDLLPEPFTPDKLGR
jgi:cytidine deaminase